MVHGHYRALDVSYVAVEVQYQSWPTGETALSGKYGNRPRLHLAVAGVSRRYFRLLTHRKVSRTCL